MYELFPSLVFALLLLAISNRWQFWIIFLFFVACRNIVEKVESDPLKWESHKISRQKKNGTSLMSSAKIPENDYPLALRHLLKRRKIPAFSLQPISPFLGLCDHLTSAVTSVGEVPVSDVNKVWNALKCYNLHPDPCWLATRECRKGRWSIKALVGKPYWCCTTCTTLVGQFT